MCPGSFLLIFVFLPFPYSMSVFDERVKIFLLAWRSKRIEGIAMDTECPFGVQFWVALLCWKVYGQFLYLAGKHFSTFAELNYETYGLNCTTLIAAFVWDHRCMEISVCWLAGFLPTGDWVLLITFLKAATRLWPNFVLLVFYEDFNSSFTNSRSQSACIPPTLLVFAHDNERLLSIWMASRITLSCGGAGTLGLCPRCVKTHKWGGCVCLTLHRQSYLGILSFME